MHTDLVSDQPPINRIVLCAMHNLGVWIIGHNRSDLEICVFCSKASFYQLYEDLLEVAHEKHRYAETLAMLQPLLNHVEESPLSEFTEQNANELTLCEEAECFILEGRLDAMLLEQSKDSQVFVC